MDLKNAPGSSGSGEPTAATDVTFSLSDADFHKLLEGTKIILPFNILHLYIFIHCRVLRLTFFDKTFAISILQENLTQHLLSCPGN